MSASVAAALGAARARIPPVEARLLLGHVLRRPAVWLEAHREEMLSEAQSESFAALVARRVAGEPVAYLLGSREFYGRGFVVTPAVLIPRPETELLVDLVREKVSAGGTATILDLGTGSGCIAVTLALELPQAAVSAVDVSPAALVVARDNAARLGARVAFHAGDWFAGLPAGSCYDLIVANPPYVAAGDPHLVAGDLRFEPLDALTDHADGLAAIRRIVATAPRWLAAGGWLLFEHGYDQAEAARMLLVAAGFTEIVQHADLAGIVRASGGRYCISRE
ncbi:MAG: peptide chain release factor N(5)-glutamine methyltransferase [Pseudomonadota bacterium]